MTMRLLTRGEIEIARSIYLDSIDLSCVELRHRKWWPFQPRNVTMAPCGHIHFHPHGDVWSDDFSKDSLGLQGHLIHELCHVWQTQQRGKLWLPLMRHPFCSYSYAITDDRPLTRYGIEQQAEIVRHAFLLRHGAQLKDKPGLETYNRLLAVFR